MEFSNYSSEFVGTFVFLYIYLNQSMLNGTVGDKFVLPFGLLIALVFSAGKQSDLHPMISVLNWQKSDSAERHTELATRLVVQLVATVCAYLFVTRVTNA